MIYCIQLNTALRRTKAPRPPLNVEKVLDTAPLPKLLTAKDLRKLIYVKRPTVVVYFRNAEGDEKANQLNLLFVLLKEIAELYGCVYYDMFSGFVFLLSWAVFGSYACFHV